MKVSHLNALRAFEAVMRTGSFRFAGEELGVTTAAVGQQIRGLEAYLGRTLFRRGPTGAKPTDEALRVKDRLTGGFSILDDVLMELRQVRTANQVSVTLPESFAENWFTRRVSEFHRQNPAVDLRLNASNRRIDLATDGFDFAIRYSPPPDSGLDVVDLFGDCVVPVCTPEFSERNGLALDLKSLAGVPLVHLDNRTPDPKWATWQDWFATFGMEPGTDKSGLRFSRISSGLQAALSGQGLVLCGITEAYDSLEAGRLILPFGPARHVRTAYRYRLLSISGRVMSSQQRRFCDWTIEQAARFRDAVGDMLDLKNT
ncbi:LysR substrate-binding domain-containing protein [Roseibium sp. Sym1]|uniref:LysR substrate-binding domain-containing protein n=1 Tax=Roseibium sp. Sym1 TaxID=3016006 RepID=UPI0022B4B2FD|nr:LysR substrate-binding domain-containing protein [Roseibium sp. Sym1]